MKVRSQELLSRIGDHKSAPTLRAAAAGCLEVFEQFEAKAAKIANDPNLTPQGRRQAIKEAAARTALPAMLNAQAPIARAADALRARRESIKLPAPDPTDIAGALQRQEIRGYLWSLKPAERMAALLTSKDERYADAVLSAPGALSGLDDEQFSLVLNATQERRFGPQVAEIAEAEAVVEAARAAFLVAQRDLQNLAGIDDRSFAALAASARNTPWLKRSADGTVVKVIPGESVYPPATSDELARGKYYANQNEFLDDNPGARAAS